MWQLTQERIINSVGKTDIHFFVEKRNQMGKKQYTFTTLHEMYIEKFQFKKMKRHNNHMNSIGRNTKYGLFQKIQPFCSPFFAYGPNQRYTIKNYL